MLNKILKLNPIDPEFESEPADTIKRSRVFNLDSLEIKAHKQDFLIRTEMGEIILEEGDEILIDRLLLQVNFEYRREQEDEHNLNEPIEEENFEEPEEFLIKPKKLKAGKEHPLAFLFNHSKDDDSHD